MQKINLDFSDKKYTIHIGKDFLNDIPSMIESSFHYDKVMIITDRTVGGLYLKNFQNAFSCDTSSIIVEAGESSKSLNVAANIYDQLSNNRISRKDCIIALGGGVVGDLAGFIASTYLRGIDFIQIPTTLLAQVDSSVGGKVGINTSMGKNLVGSFYQPKAVYIDYGTLDTLAFREIKSGMAEVIKYACIYDYDFFEKLESYSLNSIKNHYKTIIERCIQIKSYVVKIDEKEAGLRMILNYGHTIGHGIEKYYDLSVYNHGESVGIGMMYMAYIDKENIESKRLLDLLDQYQLLRKPDFEINRMMSYLLNDKKSIANKVNLIRLSKIGKAYIEEVTFEWLKEKVGEIYEVCKG